MSVQEPPSMSTSLAGRQIFNLEGHKAIVTGGASGIGRAIADGFAAWGADVAILDRDLPAATVAAQAIAEASGRRVAAFAFEASDESRVDSAVDAATAMLGPIDVLLNAAGHNVRKPMLDFTVGEFDGLMNVHVRGAFLTCRAVGRQMRELRRGSIINVASVLAHVGRADVTPYSAAKGALLQMTRAFALEMAPFGVRVNAVSPGFIDTPLTRSHPPHVREQVESATPIGRFGQPSDLVGAAVFLASGASGFVTGTTIIVDGGWTAQ